MLLTKILKNNYQDSINLMLLTKRINDFDKVELSQVMMGTEANKDILSTTNLLSDEAKEASPNDLMIVVETSDQAVMDEVLEEVELFLADLSTKSHSEKKASTNWTEAMAASPDANLAVFSIPGEYGAAEMEVALKHGLHVFSFTDNISLEDEVRLKKLAHENGLLMMGPDSGTGIISSIPIAFTNVIRSGNIGIVGASGTGIQEVTTIIDRLGGGVVHAIGTGGHDLSSSVAGITTKDAIMALEHHEATDVICVISKPAAKEVGDEIIKLLQSVSKPSVAIFLGEKPSHHQGKVYLAHTLEETAKMAVALANDEVIRRNYQIPLKHQKLPVLAKDKVIKGLYSGGTLAAEAAMLISECLHLKMESPKEGYLLHNQAYDVIDLGDDLYTQGKPHPMIDPDSRIRKIHEMAQDEQTGVILLDIVLGYGAHEDMAGELLPAITEELQAAKKAKRDLYFVATLVGSGKDPQDYAQTLSRLEAAGVLVEESNAKAVRLALNLKGHDLDEQDKELIPYTGPLLDLPQPSDKVMDLLNSKPRIINIGLQSFNESILAYGGSSEQFNWRPRAGGNKKMIGLLNALDEFSSEIDQENEKVITAMREVEPFLVDVLPAHQVIAELADTTNKTLLHAGPPLTWQEMTGPMRGSCIGALLFEKWAADEDQALDLLENGHIRFIPCHHANAVGPMGGITSAHMPVLVVENRGDGRRGYCTLNEGIGKVLRFGAYSQEVVTRLEWMRDVLGPTLSKALRASKEGINLDVLIARAITMGDEFHQRNIAASLNFLKEMAPLITSLTTIDNQTKYDVISFLANTDQFFLNVMMAIGKVIVDSARQDARGTVVTTMTRNGVDFGIRIAETGDTWYTAPVNTPYGLYFTGFKEDDGNPDIGDSAITETVGVGAMAMIAAPGVTRFVGAGGFQEALDISNEMSQISLAHNPNWTIPTWDFQGAVLGIDIRKVVETGITPLVNTGIAHKQAGVGQVGAGTVRAPLACFEKALEAYAREKGIVLD